MGSTGKTKRPSASEEPIRGVSETPEITEYHTFDTRHRDTHHYEDDGGATDRWFMENTNAKELYDEIKSSREIDHAIDDVWISGHFMRGQQYNGFSNMSRSDQAYTRIYDNLIDKARLDAPIVVHRRATAELLLGKGSKSATEAEIRNMIGRDIVSRGNMSTGAAREGLTIGNDKPIEYEIRVPAGTGYGMWLGNRRVNPWFGDGQREFMMARDLVLRPVSYEVVGGRGGSRSRAQYRVVMEVVRALEHDYS